jgi:hypothetical protein
LPMKSGGYRPATNGISMRSLSPLAARNTLMTVVES